MQGTHGACGRGSEAYSIDGRRWFCFNAAAPGRISACVLRGARMLPVNEQVFAPEPMKLRKELLYSVIGIGTVGPLFCWWRNVPARGWVTVLVVGLVIAVGRELWMRFRGRDFVYIVPEGIRVTNRRKAWLLRWTEIQTVHRFNEQVVFETVPPHRRETLSLDGHDHHKKELEQAIVAQARNVLDMKWVETLGDIFG
jgi:hypothetical protein